MCVGAWYVFMSAAPMEARGECPISTELGFG